MQSYRLITVATLVDRLKINGSLARKALHDLEEKGQIKKVVGHSKLSIYSEWHSFSWSANVKHEGARIVGTFKVGAAEDMGRMDGADLGPGITATMFPIWDRG